MLQRQRTRYTEVFKPCSKLQGQTRVFGMVHSHPVCLLACECAGGRVVCRSGRKPYVSFVAVGSRSS